MSHYVHVTSSLHNMSLGFGPYGSERAAGDYAAHVDETAALMGEPFAGYAGAFVRTTAPRTSPRSTSRRESWHEPPRHVRTVRRHMAGG